MTGATLDAGALTSFERNDRAVVTFLKRALQQRQTLAIPAGVVAQVWRDGARQARLSRLLASDLVEVIPLDDREARAVGQLCGITGAMDVIDVSVVLCARQRDHIVLTSDAEDLLLLDPELEVFPV